MATASVKLTWEDRVYDIDLMSINAAEWRVIKQHTGLRAGGFVKSFQQMDDLDADAIAGLVWIGRTRANAGVPAPWDDDLPILEIVSRVSLVDDGPDDPTETSVPKEQEAPQPD